MIKYFLLFLSLPAFAAEWTLPSANQWDWSAESATGIEGGMDQYYSGGASERTTAAAIDVTAAPYYANLANPATTGTVSAGGTLVSVVNATGFRVNDLVKLSSAWPEQATLTVTAAATADGDVLLRAGTAADVNAVYAIPVLDADTIDDVAAKIRATSFSGWTTGGSGAVITFVSTSNRDYYYGISVQSGGVAGFAASPATVQEGGSYGEHSITAINGTDITITPARSTALGATGAAFFTDNRRSIQNAINATTAGQAAYLPAGTYKIDRPLSISSSQDSRTLRGAGIGVTTIEATTGMAVMLSVGTNFSPTGAELAVTGTMIKGTDDLTVASASGWTTGQMILVTVVTDQDNSRIQAGGALIVEVFGATTSLTYTAQITGVAGNVITVYPPIPADGTYSGVKLRQKSSASARTTLVGIEDMTLDAASLVTVANGMKFDQTDRCWIRNVEVKDYNNYGIHLNESYRGQLRGCIAGPGRAGGTNSAGILADRHSCDLIEDNIIEKNSSNMQENAGSVGNVWAYNISVNNVGGNDMLLNHGAHNCFNLYEGNVANSWKSDGYFGSASHNVMFRNWFSGYDGTYAGPPAYAKRFTRQFVEAGNVLGLDGISAGDNRQYGYPNIGNSSYAGNSNTGTGDFWNDWKITGTITTMTGPAAATVTVNKLGDLVEGSGEFQNGPTLVWYASGVWKQAKHLKVTAISGLLVTLADANGATSNGTALPADGTAVELWPGQVGFQEMDDAVEPSFTQASNYESAAVGTGAITNSISPDTLPNSLAYTTKPAWFGSLAWPPVNPSSPVFSFEIIPAGYRYANSTLPDPTPAAPRFRTKPAIKRSILMSR